MRSNFNSETLLCNLDIMIEDKRGGIYIMKLPTLEDKLTNFDYDIFISFCATPLEKINKELKTSFKDRFQMFKVYKNNSADILETLNKYFAKYMVGFKYVDDSLYWGNRLVSKEIFETFCDYCAISAGVKSIKELELVITEDMDEFEKRRIEMERRIQKTKNKGSSDGPTTNLDIILTGVCYEFGYHYTELLNMTLYSIYYMYSQFGSIMSYEVGNIAAGNGLLNKKNKHKHWAS